MKTKVHFSTKMYQDTFHLKRYLASCYTEAQLENTRNLCDDVINRWEFDFKTLFDNDGVKYNAILTLYERCILLKNNISMK